MFLVLFAAFLLATFVTIAVMAGVGIVALLAAVLVGAAMLGALAAIAVLLTARHADAVRRRSSRARVLSDIQVVETRLGSNERS